MGGPATLAFVLCQVSNKINIDQVAFNVLCLITRGSGEGSTTDMAGAVTARTVGEDKGGCNNYSLQNSPKESSMVTKTSDFAEEINLEDEVCIPRMRRHFSEPGLFALMDDVEQKYMAECEKNEKLMLELDLAQEGAERMENAISHRDDVIAELVGTRKCLIDRLEFLQSNMHAEICQLQGQVQRLQLQLSQQRKQHSIELKKLKRQTRQSEDRTLSPTVSSLRADSQTMTVDLEELLNESPLETVQYTNNLASQAISKQSEKKVKCPAQADKVYADICNNKVPNFDPCLDCQTTIS